MTFKTLIFLKLLQYFCCNERSVFFIKPLEKCLRTLTLVFHVDSKNPQNYVYDEKFTSHPKRAIHKVRMEVEERERGVMIKAYGCVQRDGGFKPGEYVCISTVYFPFLKIFLIKKKNEYD